MEGRRHPTLARRAVRFHDVAQAAGLTQFANTIAAIAFDYDGDGWLDLLFGNYFRPVDLLDLDDPHVLPEDLDNAHNGGGVTLWHNVPAASVPGADGGDRRPGVRRRHRPGRARRPPPAGPSTSATATWTTTATRTSTWPSTTAPTGCS